MKIQKILFPIWLGICVVAFLITDNAVYILALLGLTLFLNGLVGLKTKKVSGLDPLFGTLIKNDKPYGASLLMFFYGLFMIFLYLLAART